MASSWLSPFFFKLFEHSLARRCDDRHRRLAPDHASGALQTTPDPIHGLREQLCGIVALRFEVEPHRHVQHFWIGFAHGSSSAALNHPYSADMSRRGSCRVAIEQRRSASFGCIPAVTRSRNWCCASVSLKREGASSKQPWQSQPATKRSARSTSTRQQRFL